MRPKTRFLLFISMLLSMLLALPQPKLLAQFTPLKTPILPLESLNVRPLVFYNAEGQVSAYQNYFGPVFVDVTNIQYDANARIVGYTETTRGGGVKVVFNILFDSAGRIISQQFTDTNLKLRFGNVSTQTFTYDEKTGKLLEFKIENGDFIAVFDGKGKRKSFELSAQMKAFIEEEQRKAVEAAKRRARKEAAKENKKLISRKEIIENAKGNKKLKRLLDTLPKDKKGRIQLGDAEIEFLLKKSRTFRRFVLSIGISKDQLKAVLNSGIRTAGRVVAVSVGAIRQSVAGKILATIREAIQARAPNGTAEEILAATLVKRIEEVFEITDEQGRIHRVTEITRLDGNGNQIERIVIDKFTFRNERGKKVKARIISVFDSQDRLTRVGETYKQKKKKGTLVTKNTTVFDPETGEIISQKTKQEFKRKRSFGSILGATLTFGLVGGILAAFDPDALPKFFATDLGKIFRIAVSAAAALSGNPFAIAASQFGLSLASGGSFSDAFKAAGISLAVFAVTSGIASYLQGIDPTALGGFGETLNTFGSNIANTLQPGQFDLARFGLQVGIRSAGEEFSNKLGAFGTVAAISLASALVGQVLGGANNPAGFDPSFFSVGSILLRSAAQGGIAEAFKNEKGLGAQFAQGVAGNATGGLSTGILGGVGKQFGNFFKVAGKTFGLFDPTTQNGQANIGKVTKLAPTSLFSNVDSINVGPGGNIVSITRKDGTIDDFTTVPGKTVRVRPDTQITDISRLTNNKVTLLRFDDATRTQFVIPGQEVLSISKTVVNVAGQTASDVLLGPGVQEGAILGFNLLNSNIDNATYGLGNILTNQRIGAEAGLEFSKQASLILLGGGVIGGVTKIPAVTSLLFNQTTARILLGAGYNATLTRFGGGDWVDTGISAIFGGLTTGAKIGFFDNLGILGNTLAEGGRGFVAQLLTQYSLNRKDTYLGLEQRGYNIPLLVFSPVGVGLGAAGATFFRNKLAGDIFAAYQAGLLDFPTTFAFADRSTNINTNNLEGSTLDYTEIPTTFDLPPISLTNYSGYYFDEN